MSSDTQQMPSHRRDRAAEGDRPEQTWEPVVDASGRTHTGRVRDDNQDRMYVGRAIFVVADGMAGRPAGAVAAETALEPVAELDHASAGDRDVEMQLRDAVVAANTQVMLRGQYDPGCSGMGTTVTAMAIDGTRAHLASVGDSRAYRLRHGQLEQLTIDHTLVQRLIDVGAITEDEASDHPKRALITRGIGLRSEVDVDVAVTDLEPDDTFLLCSDGLTGVIDDEDIVDVFRRHQQASEAADALVDRALRGGGPDNITVIVVRIGGG